MVGIQITTATLENSFLTGLLLGEGEVDIRVGNATGNFLPIEVQENISNLVPEAKGVMPELTSQGPIMVGSQFEESVQFAAVPFEQPEIFGEFYDWETGTEMNIKDHLTDNMSVLISSNAAEDLGLEKDVQLPIVLNTEFNNLTMIITPNGTSDPIVTTEFSVERVELSIVGIFDSNRPGIGAQYQGLLMSMEGLQDWMSLQDTSRNTNIISSYLISYKTDHFNDKIDIEFLKDQLAQLEEDFPVKIVNGNTVNIFTAFSPRVLYTEIIDLVFNFMSTFLNVLGLLIIFTGVLLITNVQLMSIEDREFQTGVLRAVGEKKRGIFFSMFTETLFQGILGGIFGLFGGLVFGQVVASYIAGLFGTGQFSVRPVLEVSVIISSVIIGVVLGILTGILPAIRASRVNIVEALRGIKVQFEEKSGRNLALLGVLLSIIGAIALLNNGLFNENLDYIWEQAGWNSLDEWKNILIGSAILFAGLGIISRFIDRIIAFNLTALIIWAAPVFLFIVAMGDGWISDVSGGGMNIDVFIIAIVQVVVGSVLIVGLNLSPVMSFLRRLLMRIRGVQGVAQVAPALISSHKTRSTLTFAIFAVVLTLNVIVAALIATNFSSSIGQAESDSRGIDLYITLNKPEVVLNDTSYTEELYSISNSITDVIGFKTFETQTDYTKFIRLNVSDPQSSLPIGFGEMRSEQIRGNATNAEDDNWRYDFYLSAYPDDIGAPSSSSSGGFFNLGSTQSEDEESLELSKKAFDVFFNSSYTMAAYNVSFSLEALTDFDFEDMSSLFDSDLEGVEKLEDENGSVIKNPIVFTDSLILPVGMQIYIPMNITEFGLSYQPFTIGGKFDMQRSVGFALSGGGMTSGGFSDEEDQSSFLGKIYIPERYSKFTNFFGEAGIPTASLRKPDQFDSFLIKTEYAFDDPKIEDLAREIEEFTNTENFGYRKIAGDDFLVATAVSLYSEVEESLEMTVQMTSFLSIYVNFGLIIGAVGMAVISVRNVSERKREIGMMRAIGFPRFQVMLAALLELLVLGFIGLIIGIINGLLINVGFANMLEVPVVIPWGTLGAYLSLITFIGLLAGAIPGFVASRIPAAEALRYVG
ncbi:MAG: ABC transporter permease [Candidatus Hodarchaeales archaeon]|jgi:ABC-type antimicrobial peptide transport system permease subunit